MCCVCDKIQWILLSIRNSCYSIRPTAISFINGFKFLNYVTAVIFYSWNVFFSWKYMETTSFLNDSWLFYIVVYEYHNHNHNYNHITSHHFSPMSMNGPKLSNLTHSTLNIQSICASIISNFYNHSIFDSITNPKFPLESCSIGVKNQNWKSDSVYSTNDSTSAQKYLHRVQLCNRKLKNNELSQTKVKVIVTGIIYSVFLIIALLSAQCTPHIAKSVFIFSL